MRNFERNTYLICFSLSDIERQTHFPKKKKKICLDEKKKKILLKFHSLFGSNLFWFSHNEKMFGLKFDRDKKKKKLEVHFFRSKNIEFTSKR